MFVYAFLAVVLASAAASVELWPLTGFRLYHEVRRPTHPTWELVKLAPDGSEVQASLYDLGIGFRDTERLLGRDPDALDGARAHEVCRAWASGFGAPLRIYRTRVDARSGERLTRRLVHECAP